MGVGTVFASGLSSPYGLAFDSAGNLYTLNNGGNTIEVFTPDGIGSVFANGAGGGFSIATDPGLAAIPEPSGFVLLGFVAIVAFCVWQVNRRRNRAVAAQER